MKENPAPRNLYAIGVKYLTQENYVSTYWKEASEYGVSVEDFIERYSHIDILLEEEGIVVKREEEELGNKFVEEVNYIESKLRQREDPFDDYSKSDSALEHDAYHLALIDHLRGTVYNFLESNYWFMTTDQSLIKFQKFNHEFKDKVPISILPSQLIQILRVVTPSTKEFDDAFIDLFSHSLAPSNSILTNTLIQEILSRIGIYKANPKLADKILMDTLFKKRYIECKSEGEKDELVHDALISKAKELEEQVEKLKVQTVEKSAENEELEKQLNLTKDYIAAVEIERNVIIDEKEILQNHLEEIKAENKRKNNIIWCLVLFVLVGGGDIVYLSIHNWDFVNLSVTVKTIIVGSLPIYIAIATLVLFGEKVYGKLFSLVTFIANVFGILLQLFNIKNQG